MLLSCGLHIALLAVMAVIDFSSSPSQAFAASLPEISIKDITAVTQLSPVIPKPKVTGPKETERLPLDVSTLTNVIAPAGLPDTGRLSPNTTATAIPQVAFNRTEFFSSKTDVRKICFVVDRSASMLGTFNRVRETLKNSIASLRQDQYFDVVFFGGGQIADFGQKRLLRASDKRKAVVNDFIDSVNPKGTTDAAAALIYAMTIKDSSGNGPQLIYFLTDGLDLNTNETKDVSLLIENKRKTLAPSTIINTIGFHAELSDRRPLQMIAKRSGGKFVNID